MKEKKTIVVLLSQFSDRISQLVCRLSKSRYSHAAIALDDAHEEFYSFSNDGFVIEHPFYRKKRSEMLEIRLSVSAEQHELIKEEINENLGRREKLKYSRLGFCLLLLHIPARFKNRYFCSQFVAELLSMSGVADLTKDSSLYYPAQLIDEVKYSGNPVMMNYAAV